MKNELTGDKINDNPKVKSLVIQYITSGYSDAKIQREMREAHKLEVDARTIRAFRNNFVISDKAIQKRIAEETKQQQAKIKKINEELPLQIFNMIEARKKDITTLEGEIKNIKEIQNDVHEHRKRLLGDLAIVYRRTKDRLMDFKPMNDKEGKIVRQVVNHVDDFKRAMSNKVVGLYYAKNDLTIAKCLDTIRILRGEIEQYTQLYDLHGLIDNIAKSIVTAAGNILIPSIPDSKMKSVIPKFRVEIERIVFETKERVTLKHD